MHSSKYPQKKMACESNSKTLKTRPEGFSILTMGKYEPMNKGLKGFFSSEFTDSFRLKCCSLSCLFLSMCFVIRQGYTIEFGACLIADKECCKVCMKI